MAAVRFAIDRMAEWKCRGISIGGDSSGGNLAIATALSFPENTFSSLITFYPVTKAYADDSGSWKKYGVGFGLVAAERDILRDQGLEFVNRLKNLGKEARYVLIPGSVHLFITVDGQPSAFNMSVEESAAFILNKP